MTPFKYSLRIDGAVTSMSRFSEDLKALGYKHNDRGGRTIGPGKFMVVNQCRDYPNQSTVKNGEFTWQTASNPRDYSFDIDTDENYNAALAIAAIHEGPEQYVGELVTILGAVKKVSEISKRNNGGIPSTVDKVWAVFPDGTGNICACDRGSDFARKLTPDEIIDYFKKQTTNMSTTTNPKYKVLKDTPHVKVGEILERGGTNYDWYFPSKPNFGVVKYGIQKDIVEGNPEFFERVIENITEPYKVGSRGFDVILTSKGVNFYKDGKNRVVLRETLEKLYDYFRPSKIAEKVGDIGGYEIGVTGNDRCIRIGCYDEDNRISVADLQTLINKIKVLAEKEKING